MASAFSDTLFAYIVRSVLGPQYFPHVDEISPSLWQEKALTQTTPHDSAHTTLNDPTEFADAQEKQKIDTEKGNEEPLIVGWYGPTDPEVSYNSVMLVTACLQMVFRIRRTGRGTKSYGSCSRHVFWSSPSTPLVPSTLLESHP